MEITWDDRKAATAFDDPLAQLTPQDQNGEERILLVGHSFNQRLLLVIFVERFENEVRIISARKATTKEKKDYEEGI